MTSLRQGFGRQASNYTTELGNNKMNQNRISPDDPRLTRLRPMGFGEASNGREI